MAEAVITAAAAQGHTGGQRELEALVLAEGRCTGCGACISLCPYQALHQDRTVTLHGCDLPEGRCYAYCPRTPCDLSTLRRQLNDGAELTPDLGALRGFYLTRAVDPAVRERAQHGGTVSALMTLALAEGIIDAAVLAEGGSDLLPRAVTRTEAADVAALAGSRFVVSPVVAEFNRQAGEGKHRRIGMVATPCQALALAKIRTHGGVDPAGAGGRIGLVVGLFCGWALDWKRLAGLLMTRGEPATITGMDIPPSRYHTLELYTARGTVAVPLDEVTPCVREACRTCPDMTAEFSDLSVGSARLPEGWETARGWNQVIVRTTRGAELLELARRRGVLAFREVPEGNLARLKAAARGKKDAARRADGDPRGGSTRKE